MKKFLFGLLLTVLLLPSAFAEAANMAPVITKHPEDVYAGSGVITETVTFSAEVTGSEPLTYQWQHSPTFYPNQSDDTFVNVPGANSADLSFVAKEWNAGSYRVVVGNAYGVVTSNIAYLFVVIFDPGAPPEITIDTQPAKNTEVTEGSIAGSLFVEASSTPGVTLTYQWCAASSFTDMGGPIPGETSASFAIPKTLKASGSPYSYYCWVEGRAPDLFPAIRATDVATVTVIPASIIPTGTEPVTTTTEPEPETKSSGGGCNGVMIGNGMFAALLILFLLAGRRKNNG